MRYVSIGIGKWKRRVAKINPEGAIVEEFIFPNDAEGITNLALRLGVSLGYIFL